MDKKRILFSIMILIISSSMFPQAHSVPTGQGQQLFFDNFSTSQLSPNWNPSAIGTSTMGASGVQRGNITQSGGWLTLTVSRQVFTSCFQSPCYDVSGIIANNTSPIISSSTIDQFIYMVWRIVPFNLTQIGNNPSPNNVVRNAETIFGLFNLNLGTATGIGWVLTETDSTSSHMELGYPTKQRESIGIIIGAPTLGATHCFDLNGYSGGGFDDHRNFITNSCNTIPTSSPIYSNPNNPIDLNTVHIFTMEGRFNRVGTSWAAFQVDQNAWYNFTDTACTCINIGSSNPYYPLWPYIDTVYCTGIQGAGVCPSTIPNQSLGTSVNYVLIDNFVPSTLPQGLPPPLNPSNNPLNIPQTNNPISNPFGGISPSNLWQYFANVIGQGVPEGGGNFLMSKFYFGGSILFAITVIVILISLLFTPIGRVTSPFVLSFILFIDTIANFVLGTLPPWIFAGVLIFFMAVMVGTIPSVIGGHGKGGTM